MTKQEFKTRWESDENGGGINFKDIAECAVKWGICARPMIHPIDQILAQVLDAAGVQQCSQQA